MLSALLLAGELAVLVYFFRGDFGRLSLIAGVPGAAARRRRSRVRIGRTLVLFGGAALAGLALAGRLAATVVLPGEFAPLAAAMHDWSGGELGATVAVGVAGGTVLGLGWTWQRRRRGKGPAMLGDYAALFPRDRHEAALAFATALAAGVAEELYFRLALPLLITGVTGSAVAGFAGATILFGLAHRYQRWVGVVATALAGALFAGTYLASGQLWLAMAVHAAVDVNALVLRPWVAGLIGPPRD